MQEAVQEEENDCTTHNDENAILRQHLFGWLAGFNCAKVLNEVHILQ